MKANWNIIIIIAVCIIMLVIFLVWKNWKDKMELTKQLNSDFKNLDKRESDLDDPDEE
jgi:hypothetical protein